MNYSVLQLAFLGDAVYELYIRKYLLEKTNNKIKELKEESLKYVTAKRQSYFLNELINNNLLINEELDIVKRGRNTKTHSKPKNCDVLTYKYATAFEVLVGYLYLNNKDRLNEILNIIMDM